MFKNAQAGDYAWSCILGAGKISDNLIDCDRDRPIKVRFDCGTICVYHADGKRLESDKYPELYHHQFNPSAEAFHPPARPKYQWLYKNTFGKYRLTNIPFASKEDAKKALQGWNCVIIEPVKKTKKE